MTQTHEHEHDANELMACQFEEWLKVHPPGENHFKYMVNKTLLTLIRSGRVIYHGNGKLSLREENADA